MKSKGEPEPRLPAGQRRGALRDGASGREGQVERKTRDWGAREERERETHGCVRARRGSGRRGLRGGRENGARGGGGGRRDGGQWGAWQGVTLGSRRPPRPPVPQTGAPSWGRRWEAGPGRALFSPGMLGSGWARGTWGRGPPSLPRDPLRSRCQAPCSSWRVGSPPPLPILLGGCRPKQIHPHMAAGKGLGPRPPAAHSLLPTKVRRGEMAGAVDVKITDPFIKGGKKAKIQKKKKYS